MNNTYNMFRTVPGMQPPSSEYGLLFLNPLWAHDLDKSRMLQDSKMPAHGSLESSSDFLMRFGCSIVPGFPWLDGVRLSPTQANEVMSKSWLGPSPCNLPLSFLSSPSLRVTHTLQLGPEER